MNKLLPSIAAALALACLSSTASADEVRVFATASFGDQEFGFGNAEYGWGSGHNIFTVGASLVALGGGSDDSDEDSNDQSDEDSDEASGGFDIGINGGYTYLFNPDGSTGFLEGRAGTFDVSKFSENAFYELSVGYRWYLSDRAALGWNIIGYEQRRGPDKEQQLRPGEKRDLAWEASPFTRVQLIIALD